MLFSSVTFLYYFLPVTLAVYFLVPARGGSVRARNLVLLVASLVFYLWGEPVYVLLMLGQTVSGWAFGLLIERGRALESPRLMKTALFGAIAIGIGCLGFFKYADFFIGNISALFGQSASLLGLALPIGISFYTFQILSYDIDLYGGKAKVQKSLPVFATYVTLFPQLIAGPIVRYVHIGDSLAARTHSIEDFYAGARRFVFGLAKKVLLANTLGELVLLYKSAEAGGEADALYAWLYIIAYALHIYFDFSGYSDMAIGLGRIFGFRFLENFNYPYTALSLTDFWRRWHISMSSWFRDYVYIKLGGSRVGPARRLFNILFVWLLTGFWHGAGWTFIVWGLYYGLALLLEKYALVSFLGPETGVFGHSVRRAAFALPRRFYVVIVLLVGWVFFDADTLTQAAERLSLMFGGAESLAGPESLYYLRSYLVPLIVAGIGATPLPVSLVSSLSASPACARILSILEPVLVVALLLTVTAYLADGSFNPFIYFRF